MKKQNVRVLIASEYPGVRQFLKQAVEEGGAAVIGQAHHSFRALALARNLRPDVALVDCNLPYAVGRDTVPLSRISGLDTAQAISEEIPNVRVILLNNLDLEDVPEESEKPSLFTVGGRSADKPLTLAALLREADLPSGRPLFASIITRIKKARGSLGRKLSGIQGRWWGEAARG